MKRWGSVCKRIILKSKKTVPLINWTVFVCNCVVPLLTIKWHSYLLNFVNNTKSLLYAIIGRNRLGKTTVIKLSSSFSSSVVMSKLRKSYIPHFYSQLVRRCTVSFTRSDTMNASKVCYQRLTNVNRARSWHVNWRERQIALWLALTCRDASDWDFLSWV